MASKFQFKYQLEPKSFEASLVPDDWGAEAPDLRQRSVDVANHFRNMKQEADVEDVGPAAGRDDL